MRNELMLKWVSNILISNFDSADNCAVLFGNYRMICEFLDCYLMFLI